MREVRRALPEHRGRPRHQRRVHDVAVAHHPADVRHAPENVVVLHVPEVLEVVVRSHHVAAVDVDDALGPAGGAAGVQDVQRVLGVHHLGGAVDAAARHQPVEVGLALAQVLQGQLTPENDDVFQHVATLHGLVGDALQVHPVAPAITHVPRDQRLRVGVLDAVAQRAHAEAGVHHAVDGADAGAGQHADGPLRRQGHVDDHPVPLAHAQGFQPVGEPVHLLRQPGVGVDLLGAVLAQPDERRLVAPLGGQVPVQRVVGDVGLAAHEPAEVGILPLENLVPPAEPVQLIGRLGPEPLGVLHGAGVDAVVVGHRGLLDHVGRRRDLPGLLQEMVNLSLLNHKSAPRT